MRWFALGWLATWGGCCDDDGLYASCEEPADCEVPEDAEAECLDKSSAGFCTWQCGADSECELEGDEWARVCAPFESNPGSYCFPSCREDVEDEADACPEGTSCRSTGGGSDNRKICFPDDGTPTE